MQTPPPEIVAAVDLGSNSFHLLVCRLHDGTLQTVDSLKEMVRLAAGLNEDSVLDNATQQRALACLERFGQRIRHLPHDSVRVVGTNTLRTAKNAQSFITRAEQALNHPIHIITGIEEARLIYSGVAYSLASSGAVRFVMDIGGGSTEYIIGTGNTPLEKESLYMGCVSVSQRFFKNGKLSRLAFDAAVLFAKQELEPVEQKFQRRHWHEAIGASGSLRAIARVLQAKNWSNNGITRAGLEQLVGYICHHGHINDLGLPDLDLERLPVFPGGVAIAYATFLSLGIEQMTVSDGALREGLIQDLLGRLYNHDIRTDTAKELAGRYHTDFAHAVRVHDTAKRLLRQLVDGGFLPANETLCLLLEWAAIVHEIGRDIAHSQYHKHSAYIIEHGDLAGFSNQDKALLAAIIRSHRRKFSRARFQNLPEPWRWQAPFLCIVLRLAVLLRRNRHDEPLPEFTLTANRNQISLTFPNHWLDLQPLTRADLSQEADYLKASGFNLSFR